MNKNWLQQCASVHSQQKLATSPALDVRFHQKKIKMTNEILNFTIDDNTKKIVKQAFNSNEEISPIDCDFGNFRLT